MSTAATWTQIEPGQERLYASDGEHLGTITHHLLTGKWSFRAKTPRGWVESVAPRRDGAERIVEGYAFAHYDIFDFEHCELEG